MIRSKKETQALEVEKNIATQQFRKSVAATTEELDLHKKNAKDNVVGRYVNDLKQIAKVVPDAEAKIIEAYQKRDPSINSIQDIANSIYDYLEYYSNAIKTQEELEFQFERAKKFVHYENRDLPVVIEFDWQYYNELAIDGKPTFYSWFNPKTKTEYGEGAYHIAFPATQAYLTDDEVMVAMKHEWGHIFQGHCTTVPRDQFEASTNNQAMDISINIGMTPEEQDLLLKLARKLWMNNSTPCISLARPNGQGGFGIRINVSVADWKSTSGHIRLWYKAKGGGPGTGGNPPPPISAEVKVGDYVFVRGTKPPIYGKVIDIDANGKATYEEFTPEEWEEIKKQQG
jgi:hypothetical protein